MSGLSVEIVEASLLDSVSDGLADAAGLSVGFSVDC